MDKADLFPVMGGPAAKPGECIADHRIIDAIADCYLLFGVRIKRAAELPFDLIQEIICSFCFSLPGTDDKGRLPDHFVPKPEKIPHSAIILKPVNDGVLVQRKNTEDILLTADTLYPGNMHSLKRQEAVAGTWAMSEQAAGPGCCLRSCDQELLSICRTQVIGSAGKVAFCKIIR
jgi:hypothetical protein